MASAVKAVKGETVSISKPKFKTVSLELVGTAPFLQARFSEKAKQAMKSKMLSGSTAGKGKKRDARDFDEDFKQAFHKSTDGWTGIPAAAFRNAAIDACRMAGFQMTRAKMSVFIEADGFDVIDGQPLVKLVAGEPERLEMITRNATGVPDIRVRPMWRIWGANVRVRYDADQFTESDVLNLFARAGLQVGVGEGRPFSKSSNGMGYGTFDVRSVVAQA
jgi:hypothetical protein